MTRDLITQRRAEEARAALLRAQAARAEAESAQRRFAFLADLGAALADSLDYETNSDRVAERCVPFLADSCWIDLLQGDGSLRCLAAAAREPSGRTFVEKLRASRPLRRRPLGIARALRSGQSVLYKRVTEKTLTAVAPARHRHLLRSLQVRTCLIVPLIAHGRSLGTLSLCMASSGRRFGNAEVGLAEEVARRFALAIDNSRLYQELEEAVRVRDEFLATVSHDLKSPLTSIKGFAQFVRQQAERIGSPEGQRVVDGLARIDATVTRMTALIDELIDVARLQAGRRLELNRQPTDLVALVRQAIGEHQQAAPNHRLGLTLDVNELVGLWDAVRLQQVLDNLLSNAIKYTPEGRRITVRVSRQAGPGQGAAVLAVSDEGIGIPSQDLGRIFERFQRGRNVARRVAGSGIGLSGVRQIVEQHDGTITVESRVRVGTTFTVRLPLGRTAS